MLICITCRKKRFETELLASILLKGLNHYITKVEETVCVAGKQVPHRRISDGSSAITVFQKELDPPDVLQTYCDLPLGLSTSEDFFIEKHPLLGTWLSELDAKNCQN